MFNLRNIQVIRQGREILAVDELAIKPNAITVILGHNGSGKSTLMKLLARQITADQGQVHVDNAEIQSLSQRELARKIAFLPQDLPDVHGLSVRELVLQGRYPWRGLFGQWRPSDHEVVADAMAQTDVSRYAEQQTDLLSGGERQRAWVAMLLAQQSPMLLLDEPTSALDLSHQYELMTLLQHLNQNTGRGVVVILHDLNLAARFADQVIALKQGRIAFNGAPDELYSEARLTDLYDIDIRLCPHPSHHQPIAVVA